MDTSTFLSAGFTRTPAQGWMVVLLSRLQVSSIILTSYTYGSTAERNTAKLSTRSLPDLRLMAQAIFSGPLPPSHGVPTGCAEPMVRRSSRLSALSYTDSAAYWQPHVCVSTVPQQADFAAGSQHAACSAGAQHDDAVVLSLADLLAKTRCKFSGTPA
jgi:hypothetical protein